MHVIYRGRKGQVLRLAFVPLARVVMRMPKNDSVVLTILAQVTVPVQSTSLQHQPEIRVEFSTKIG